MRRDVNGDGCMRHTTSLNWSKDSIGVTPILEE
jgi:hypothetical protein